MITYPAKSYYQAAALATKDAENWTPKERAALAEVAALGEWHHRGQELCNSCDPYSPEIQTHNANRPHVYVGDWGTGKYFAVSGLKFIFCEAVGGINIGIMTAR